MVPREMRGIKNRGVVRSKAGTYREKKTKAAGLQSERGSGRSDFEPEKSVGESFDVNVGAKSTKNKSLEKSEIKKDWTRVKPRGEKSKINGGCASSSKGDPDMCSDLGSGGGKREDSRY